MKVGMAGMMVGWGLVAGAWLAFADAGGTGFAAGRPVPVQIPYEDPPKPEFPDVEPATPAPDVLSEEELKRAEALLPLLEGRQELYVIGEFVHLGKPVVPVLVKALTMPGSRLRYNAIEAMSIINDPRAVSPLLETAAAVENMTRVRAHALRVAVRMAPLDALATLRALVKDQHDTMRRTVAFEARHVRHPDAVSLLIRLLGDEERYVAVAALESFRHLTRWAGPPHDWQGSTHEQRLEWGEEWKTWWEETLKKREAAPDAPPPAPSPMSWRPGSATPHAGTTSRRFW